ncbi:MAG: hypothetical protein AVDCRST_MAG12-302, partial [uncultured Rubrobacteraceae bacterium]
QAAQPPGGPDPAPRRDRRAARGAGRRHLRRM